MKPVGEWTGADILNLPAGEYDYLEAKGRRAVDISLPEVNESKVRQTLSKAVSALANSGGGNLVLGIADPESGWSVDDGGVSVRTKGASTRQWLEDVIPALTDPEIRSFNVFQVESFPIDAGLKSGRAVYVVGIPDSPAAPHQALDNIYYGRVGGKSRPLNHRFVMDIVGRRTHPIFEVSASFEHFTEISTRLLRQEKEERAARRVLHVSATNRGKVLANHVHLRLEIPTLWLLKDHSPTDSDSEKGGVLYTTRWESNTRRDVLDVEMLSIPKYGPSWFDPVLPGLAHSWTIDLVDGAGPPSPPTPVFWSVYADNAPVNTGALDFDKIEVTEGPDRYEETL